MAALWRLATSRQVSSETMQMARNSSTISRQPVESICRVLPIARQRTMPVPPGVLVWGS